MGISSGFSATVDSDAKPAPGTNRVKKPIADKMLAEIFAVKKDFMTFSFGQGNWDTLSLGKAMVGPVFDEDF